MFKNSHQDVADVWIHGCVEDIVRAASFTSWIFLLFVGDDDGFFLTRGRMRDRFNF